MRKKLQRHTKRVLVGIAGGIVLLIGLVMIPYPGPGWLVTFAGLALLSTEFTWAHRLLERMRIYYDNWIAWLKRQRAIVRLLVVTFTGVVVILTIWIMNGYGLIDSWFSLDQPWSHSPFVR